MSKAPRKPSSARKTVVTRAKVGSVAPRVVSLRPDARLRALAKDGDVIIPRKWGGKLVARVPIEIDGPPLSVSIVADRR